MSTRGLLGEEERIREGEASRRHSTRCSQHARHQDCFGATPGEGSRSSCSLAEWSLYTSGASGSGGEIHRVHTRWLGRTSSSQRTDDG